MIQVFAEINMSIYYCELCDRMNDSDFTETTDIGDEMYCQDCVDYAQSKGLMQIEVKPPQSFEAFFNRNYHE